MSDLKKFLTKSNAERVLLPEFGDFHKDRPHHLSPAQARRASKRRKCDLHGVGVEGELPKCHIRIRATRTKVQGRGGYDVWAYILPELLQFWDRHARGLYKRSE